MVDYYDFLQISPNAEAETIHRVFHFLAARYHPDNQKSGDVDKFQLLKKAHDVLSDPASRAEYDALRKQETAAPFSMSIDFLDSMEGELNRRLAVLAVLYYQRRRSPHAAELSLKEIEERMGFPRDYLDFTLWYLKQKNYITKADNAEYTLTANGVDFVETERAKFPLLNKLLTSSSESSGEAALNAQAEGRDNQWEEGGAAFSKNAQVLNHSDSAIWMEYMQERRKGLVDRRVGAPDLREIKVERRKNGGDRRASVKERKKPN